MSHVKKAPTYSPSWKTLYTKARQFLATKPWDVFENEDVFLVQTPQDQQIYLCCVMGNGGEEFGLNAFRGPQGIDNFFQMLYSHQMDPRRKDMIYEMDMLSFSLAPRDFMDGHDQKVMKKLMLSFRGSEWPLFRSYRPKYQPWFLTEAEIESLCICMDQTLVLLEDAQETLSMIRSNDPDSLLLRVQENGQWKTRMIKTDQLPIAETPQISIDDISTKRLSALPATGPQEEIDLITLPMTITDHEPPYYAQSLVGVTTDFFANQYGMYTPFSPYMQEACDDLVQAFLSRGATPAMLILPNESSFADAFEPIADKAGIPYLRKEVLPHLDDFRERFRNDHRGPDPDFL